MKTLITHPLAPCLSYERKGKVKTLSKIIWILFLFLTFPVFSEISICDNADISYTWTTITEICNGWTKITNISGISSFSGEYQDITTGYWWMVHSYTGSEIIQSMPTWYVWNIFWDESWQKTITKTSYNTPVWFFSAYKNTSVLFPTLEEILYTAQKIYFPNMDSWSWGGSSADNQNTCDKPEQIGDIQGAIKKQEYTDILELSWEAQGDDTKFKIIQSYPSSETFYVDQWNTSFERQDLEDGKSYHYFVVPYNDCWDGIYSDSIQVDYSKQISDEPYLEIKWDKIYLKNTQLISLSQREYPDRGEGLWNIELKCSLYWEEQNPLNPPYQGEVEQDNYIYQINISYIEEPFECYATYFDVNQELQQTPTVINIPNKTYITQEEAWNILLSDSWQSFQELYYYLNLQSEELLSYEQFSLFLINSKASIILTDQELSLKILKNLWMIRAEVNGVSKIKYEDFVGILPKVGMSFRQDVLERITQDFQLTSKKVYEDTLRSYIIHTELHNPTPALPLSREGVKINSFEQEQLISCFTYEWCGNIELYHWFLEKIEKKFVASEIEYKNLWIDVDSEDRVTWEVYIEILFKVLWKEGFYEERYSLSQYSEFVGVLKEGIVNWDNFYSQEVDFLWSNRFSLMLYESDIFHKISHLTQNYLWEVIEIHKDIDKREELFNILRSYLD